MMNLGKLVVLFFIILSVIHSSRGIPSSEKSSETFDVPGQAGVILNLISYGEISQAENLLIDLLLIRDIDAVTYIFANSFTNNSLSENLSEIVVSIYSKNERPLEVIFGISIVYERVEEQDQIGLVNFLEKVISKIGTSRVGLQGLGQVLDFTFTVQTGAIRVAFSEALSLVQDNKSCFIIAPIIISAKNSAGPMEKFFTQQLLQEDPKILECFEIEEQIKSGDEFLRSLDESNDFFESESDRFIQYIQNLQYATIYEIFIGALQNNQTLDFIELILNVFTQDQEFDFAQNFVSALQLIFQAVDEHQRDEIEQILGDLFLRFENSNFNQNFTTQNPIVEFIVNGINLNSTQQNFIFALEKTINNITCEIPNLFQDIFQQIEYNNNSLILDLLYKNDILNACIQFQHTDEKISPQIEIFSPIAEGLSLVQKTLDNIPPLQKEIVNVPPQQENVQYAVHVPTQENVPNVAPVQSIEESAVLSPAEQDSPPSDYNFVFSFSFSKPNA